jgi:hypothetical protein
MRAGLFDAIIQWIPLLALLGIGVIAARFNKNIKSRLNRLGLLWRLAALAVTNYAFAHILISADVSPDTAMALWGFVIIPTSTALNAYWAVERLRDIGAKTKRLAYMVGFLPFMPFINLYLLLKRGGGGEHQG